MSESVRAGIQQYLDALGDGWSVRDYVVCMGLERINPDGRIETMPWWHAPADQPEYVTDGLLLATEAARVAEDHE